MESSSASLHRDQPRKMIAGVCAGLAAHFGWEPVLVRALFLIAALLSFGLAIGAYLILWVMLPASAQGPSAAEELLAKARELFTAPPPPPPAAPPRSPAEPPQSPAP